MRRTPSTLLSFCSLSTLILCILILSAPSFGAAPDRIAGAIASGQLIKLSAGVPMKAQPQYDQGPVDPSLKLSYMTLLTVPSASQQKAIDRLLAQQQDRHSPLYHRWLTPEQYADHFGLSANDTQKLTAWLQSQGFSILSVARARNFIVFSGTAAQAETAFQTQIHNFNVTGETHFSNTTPPSIPAALSGIVTGIRGLSNFRPKPHIQRRKANYSFPIPNTNPQEYAFFLAPGDLETIYDIAPLYATGIDGTGQTLAVMGQTDVYLADLNDFRGGFGLSTIPTTGAGDCTTDASGLIIAPCNATNLQYVLVNADPGSITSLDDLGEADLDLEWSGAVAQNAQIVYVNAPDPNGDGVWDSWYYAVDNVVAPVITMSYGICELGEALTPGGQGTIKPNEGTFTADEAELKQANLAGITFMNSSGDVGAAGCDTDPPGTTQTFTPLPPYLAAQFGLAVSYPASSPEVTGVGGTMTTISELSTNASDYWYPSNNTNGNSNGGSSIKYIPEAAWNDDAEIGAYCNANPNDTANCDPTSVAGQIQITNAQTFQEDWWIASSGGGPSNCWTINGSGVCTGGFPQPAWQQNLSIPGQTTAVRFVPDVSLLASANLPGYISCFFGSCVGGIANGNFSVVGGTSASTPIFAGMVTLLNQYVVKKGFQTTTGLGNANPNLYQIATYNQAALAFHPVTTSDFTAAPGSNVVYCQKGKPTNQPTLQCPSTGANAGTMGYLSANADATTGYNLVTGLGSVNANNLATAWGELFTATTTSISAGSAQVFQGQLETFTITVTPPTATGVVSFKNNGSAYGTTATLTSNNDGTVQFTTSQLPVGTDSVIAIYNGIYATSTSASSASVSVVTPNFTLAPATGAISTAQGGTAGPDTINVTSTNGFVTAGQTAVALTYSCSGLPSESTCSFSPSSQTNSATPTVSILTTAPSAQLRSPLGRGNRIFYALLLPGLFGIFLTVGSRKRATRGVRLLSFIVVLGLSTMWLAACGGGGGGGSSNPGTPQGTYTITINAKTAAGVQGTAGTVMLTVN